MSFSTVLLYLYDYDVNYGLDLKRQSTQSCRSLREKYVDASKFITNELKLSVESRDFTIPLTLIIFSVTPALFSALHRYDPLTSSGPGLLMVRTCLTLSGELLSWCLSTLNNPRPGNQRKFLQKILIFLKREKFSGEEFIKKKENF